MKILAEVEAEAFLEKQKLPVAKRIIAKTEANAVEASRKLGFPVALKIIGKNILHKSDVGGVKLNLKNEQEIISAFQQLKKISGFQSALVQNYREGVYIIVGLKKDPVFNHVVLVGSGGIYTEILKDTSMRVCPIDRNEARKMLEELKIYPILKGARGAKFNTEQIINILLKISNLAKTHKNIQELDINPLIVNSKEAIIIDARMVLE